MVEWSNWIPSVIAGGALAFIWADVRKIRVEWRRALYKDDGTLIYISRDECKTMQHSCQAAVCQKLASVAAKLESMDQRREEQRNIIIEQLMMMSGKIEGLASRMDEYIRNHQGTR